MEDDILGGRRIAWIGRLVAADAKRKQKRQGM